MFRKRWWATHPVPVIHDFLVFCWVSVFHSIKQWFLFLSWRVSSPDTYHMETVSYFPSLLLPLSGSFDIAKWIVKDSLTNTVPACISWCILHTNSVCINSSGVKCCGVILYNQYIYILSWNFHDITEICSSFDATFWTKT